MQPKLKHIQKASDIYEKIKLLDSEIIIIEKMAMTIASKKTEIKFSMAVTDIDAKDADKDKCSFDEDGSITHMSSMGILSLLSSSYAVPDNSKFITTIDKIIGEKEALYILGAIVSIKNDERKSLLNKIESLGFSI